MVWLKTALIASLAGAAVMWFGAQMLGVPPQVVWIFQILAASVWAVVVTVTELASSLRKRGRGRSQAAREGAQ